MFPTRKCNKLQLFFVPDSKMIQITMLFLSPTRKCYELQCFFCPRLENVTNYNGFFVPDSKNTQITTVILSPTRKCQKLQWFFPQQRSRGFLMSFLSPRNGRPTSKSVARTILVSFLHTSNGKHKIFISFTKVYLFFCDFLCPTRK